MTVTKYSANGNDFLLMIKKKKKDRSKLAKRLCHRQNGVGADGLVILLPHPEHDFEWEFYNADGSVATMCGNASRAVAHFAMEKGISDGDIAEFLTGAGVIRARVNGRYVVSDMTTPRILSEEIDVNGEKWWFIDTGVPHLIAIRESIEDFDIKQAHALRNEYNCNVNICRVDDNKLYVRTYERGIEDETLACGTGMVACFIRANNEKLLENNVQVFPKSGDELYISVDEGTYKFGGQVTKTFVAETIE